MKKRIGVLAILAMIMTLVSGCGLLGFKLGPVAQEGVREDFDGKIPAFSEEKLIGMSWGGAGYGDRYECMSLQLVLQRDKTLVASMNGEELGRTVLDDANYKAIEENLDLQKLYTLDPMPDDAVCDGNSRGLTLYLADGSTFYSGAYMAKNPYLNECIATVRSNIPIDWVSEMHYQGVEKAKIEDGYYDDIDIAEGDEGYDDDELSQEAQSFYIVIDYSGEGEYISDTALANVPPELEIPSIEESAKEANEIIDEEDWFEENGFLDPRPSAVESYFINDGNYDICRSGEGNPNQPTCLDIYSDEFEYMGTFDLTPLLINPEWTVPEEEWPYCPKYVKWAHSSEDGEILYVSIAHDTYSNLDSDTGYIVAVDMATGELLWKSESLVANAWNFVVCKDAIICGYGFTDETDYLYLLDRHTGEKVDKIKLKTGPDYIFERDGILYVRTYDTNYEFTLN